MLPRARNIASLLLAAAAAVAAALTAGGCVRLGSLGAQPSEGLAADLARLAPEDPAALGPHAVAVEGVFKPDGAVRFPFVVYRPKDLEGPRPAVVFLPGLMAPESQYEGYARLLASHGIAVAVRGGYGPLRTDRALARDGCALADWLALNGIGDPARLAIAGHSMGAKDAILAAAQDPRFRAVVALDPDDQGDFSVIDGPLARLQSPLLLVGAEVGWKGAAICAPREHNYQRFFERAPAGTVELELREADHVQVLDDPDAFGLGLCRRGSADSRTVRRIARGATVAFFREHLLGGEPLQRALGADLDGGADARMRVRPAAATVVSPQAYDALKTRSTPAR